MSVELLGVVLLGLGYLALLFACGMAVERGWVPVRITRHPIVYTLALGVYASAWAIYGSVELAAQAGFWLPGILPRCQPGLFCWRPYCLCPYNALLVPTSSLHWRIYLRFATDPAGQALW